MLVHAPLNQSLYAATHLSHSIKGALVLLSRHA